MKFHQTLTKDQITSYVEGHSGAKSEAIKRIQHLKEDAVHRLASNLGGKVVDPLEAKGVEDDYFALLQQMQSSIDPHFTTDEVKKEIEAMFKKEAFADDYIGNFQHGIHNKYLETSWNTLSQREGELNSKRFLQKKEQDELHEIQHTLHLLDARNVKNTHSRTISFDKNYFQDTEDKFNVHCFFEQDKQGNKNYFSINELLNDLETFGVEFGYPVVDMESLGRYDKRFLNVQKYIRLALLKNILAKYRDYQEVLLYNFVDYTKQEVSHHQRVGVMAEQLVEWSFRNFAHLDDKYVVKVTKASVGEDQHNKVDLIVQLKDKKTGINITKELQLTINHNKDVLAHKRNQIALQKQYRGVDMDLLEFEMNLLGQKIALWKNLNRPVGGLYSLLSIEDKSFLKMSFDRIVDELEHKKYNLE